MSASFCFGITSVSNAVKVNQITAMNVDCGDNGHRFIVASDGDAPYGYTVTIS